MMEAQGGEMPAVVTETSKVTYLDGNSLEISKLIELGKPNMCVELTEEAWQGVRKSRQVVDDLLTSNTLSYGINTGFGKFARTRIDKDKLVDLQKNLIRSHCAGVGNPIAVDIARRCLVLRINTLAKGYSGISEETLRQIVDFFNAGIVAYIPEKGTVGASGDLAPMAHIALGVMGEGVVWLEETGWADAAKILEMKNLKPISLKPKEGLSMINGCQFITAIGVTALERARMIALQADVVASLTLEALQGSMKAFDKDIHRIRPHRGQVACAQRLRSLLHSEKFPSQIYIGHENCDKVQDAYCLRCVPQVHGIVVDTIDFVTNILLTEMNSGTDNPIVFPDRGVILSGGNFHGEYPAKALDYLGIAIHELASISERRIERLMNPFLSELPAFLIKEGGLNSGLMVAHVTAASLVSENKVLVHPSSSDSVSTSAATEDHVSMGGFSARKTLEIVQNVETVLAIELLAAAQAMTFHKFTTTEPLSKIYNFVWEHIEKIDKDRVFCFDIEKLRQMLQEGKLWDLVSEHVEKYIQDEN